MARRFSAPWTVEEMPGGTCVKDANEFVLVRLYARKNEWAADMSKVYTWDEARRIAYGIARLPELLGNPKP
jgi:hypothetical protein